MHDGSPRCQPAHNGRHRTAADHGPVPAVVVDADGQLHGESGIVTHADEDPRPGSVALAVLRRPDRAAKLP